MYEYLKQKYSAILDRIRRISKRTLINYSLIVASIIICLAVLFVFQAKVNRSAAEEFRLATSYYQEAEGLEDKQARLDKLEEAKLLYQNILSRFWVRDKKMALLYLGNCLYSLKEYEQAIEILQEFDQKYEKDYFAPWAKAKLAACYEQVKRYEEAIHTYEKILEEHPQSSVCPQALLEIARCQELEGNLDEAQKSYEELLSRYPLSQEKSIAEVMIQRLRAKGKK